MSFIFYYPELQMYLLGSIIIKQLMLVYHLLD